MLDFRTQLNSSQYLAVTTSDGPVLVIAGAGSGKTRVIEYRVLYLVQNKISPTSILLLTFTRRAAREMLARAATHDSRCKNVEGGTFHSFGYKILKQYGTFIGLSDSLTLLDEGDSEEAIHICCNILGFFRKEKRFPGKETLRTIISMSVNRNISIPEVLVKEYPHLIEYSSDIEALRKKYIEYKVNKNYVDYDDLLLYLKLLLENNDIRNRLSKKYRYIMVDEYQDTNSLQADIICLLARKHRNVMVVGDDAQSIYGFRGASHKNIMEFPKRFPGCKIIKLEKNYRSTQSILDLANAVLENMTDKYSKCLISANKKPGIKPQLLYFKNAYEEARWVAGKIKEMYDEGIPFNHQGVLYRSSHISIPLQAELSSLNIPYQVFGGPKFYETAHVKDILSHLKVVVNPGDELSWNRVLMLVEGIGPKTAKKITDEIIVSSSLNDVLKKIFSKYSNKLKKLKDTLESVNSRNKTTGEQFEIILDYYKPLMKDKFDDWHLRLNDLEILRQLSAKYDLLEEFLADFAIELPEKVVRIVEPSKPEDEKPLTLSTIHSAKGLEWETVFFIGLMDGILPSSFALNSQEEIEEELRLFYVGITRAKNHLFLSFNCGNEFHKLSRFINVQNVLSKLENNLPDKNIKDISIPEEPEIPAKIYNKKSLIEKIIDFFK